MNNKHSYLQLGKFFPPDWGGIETVTYNILLGLTEQGLKNAVIVFGKNNLSELLSVGNCSAKIFRVKYKKLFQAPFGVDYIKALKKNASEYDIVIVHIPNPFAAIALALSGYKGKVVLYWHSDVVNKGILGSLLVPLERWLISRANIVIAPTKVHLNFSRYRALLLPKGYVVPYPIDPQLVSVADRCREIVRMIDGKMEIRILAIGRLVEYKGLEYLVRAIPSLLSEYSIRVDILGDGQLKPNLDSLIYELGLNECIFLRGSVTEDERNAYLLKADIFCLPSITKQEMYGMVQIEAMAYGLPIISTGIVGSGSPELTRMTGAGIIVDPCSAEKITLAIKALIDDAELYSTLSTAGLDAIANLFQPSTLINELCEICSK
jgi:rhamnosyl/mannosyltransferase